MLSVTFKPFILSVVMLNAIKINVVLLSVVMPFCQYQPSFLSDTDKISAVALLVEDWTADWGFKTCRQLGENEEEKKLNWQK